MATKVDLARRFVRSARKLRKKYPNIGIEIQALIDQLEQGQTPGSQIKGVGYTAYKVRLASEDLQRGKSGGFRVIYYVQTSEGVVLITIYSKSEQTDISVAEIRRLIDEYLKSQE